MAQPVIHEQPRRSPSLHVTLKTLFFPAFFFSVSPTLWVKQPQTHQQHKQKEQDEMFPESSAYRPVERLRNEFISFG